MGREYGADRREILILESGKRGKLKATESILGPMETATRESSEIA